MALNAPQQKILDHFRRYFQREGHLPSSAEAQRPAAKRDRDVPSYAQILRTFDGLSWRELSALAAQELSIAPPTATRRPQKRSVADRPPTSTLAPSPAAPRPLSDRQFELCWELTRAPRLLDHIDGRTLRPLLIQGLAHRSGDWISATDATTAAVKAHLQTVAADAAGRTAAIYRALLAIDSLVPQRAEVQIGAAITEIDDILVGFYRHARRVDGQPQRRADSG